MPLRCSLSGTFRGIRAHLSAWEGGAVVRLGLLITLILLAFNPARAGQQDYSPYDAQGSSRGRDPFRRHGDKMTYQRIEQLNAKRYREMSGQAARLVQLATELHADADRPASTDIQKAEAIAKIAHSVRQAMEYPITPSPFQF